MIIMDDPIDIDTVISKAESETMIQKLTPWLERLDIADKKSSEFWVIGHRFSIDDFYMQIQKRKVFESLILPSRDPSGKFLVSEFFDSEEKFQNKVIDTHTEYEFKAYFQQESIQLGNCEFEWSWLENQIVDVVPEGRLVSYLDPAYGADKKDDQSAGAVGMDYKGGVLITGLNMWRISSDWKKKFTDWAVREGAVEMNIEDNNAKTLPEDVKTYVRDSNYRMTVKGFSSTKNKEFRIGDMAVPARNGKIWFARHLVGSPAYNELKTQWIMFPNISHDDLLDVVEYITTRCTKKGLKGVFDRGLL